MKIISKYKDYYDSAAVYGFDESVIYKREISFLKVSTEEKVELPQKRSFLRDYSPVSYQYEVSYVQNGVDRKLFFTFSEAFLIVAGKAYSVLLEKNPQDRSSNRHIYNNDKNEGKDYSVVYGVPNISKIPKYIEDNLPDIKNIKIKRLAASHSLYNKKENEKKSLAYKHDKEVFLSKDFTDLCVKQNAVSLLILNPQEMVKNPILKNFGIEKVVDPSLMHQTIFQFVSGVLANNENKMASISDFSKVEKHGFDPKYGFRTRPKTKM